MARKSRRAPTRRQTGRRADRPRAGRTLGGGQARDIRPERAGTARAPPTVIPRPVGRPHERTPHDPFPIHRLGARGAPRGAAGRRRRREGEVAGADQPPGQGRHRGARRRRRPRARQGRARRHRRPEPQPGRGRGLRRVRPPDLVAGGEGPPGLPQGPEALHRGEAHAPPLPPEREVGEGDAGQARRDVRRGGRAVLLPVRAARGRRWRAAPGRRRGALRRVRRLRRRRRRGRRRLLQGVLGAFAGAFGGGGGGGAAGAGGGLLGMLGSPMVQGALEKLGGPVLGAAASALGFPAAAPALVKYGGPVLGAVAGAASAFGGAQGNGAAGARSPPGGRRARRAAGAAAPTPSSWSPARKPTRPRRDRGRGGPAGLLAGRRRADRGAAP